MLAKIQQFVAQFFFRLIGICPLWFLHGCGSVLGRLAAKLPLKQCYYVQRNIELCFPNWSIKQRNTLFNAAMIESGKALFEAPMFWVRSKKQLQLLIKQVNGVEQLQQAAKSNKGVILLGCHMGGYYLANAYIAPNYPKTVWIYKRQKGLIESLTQRLRNQFGATFVETSASGVRKMLRHLKLGHVVGMSCDHNALATSGVFAHFFGIPVSTMTLAARLANKTNAHVFFMFMERLPKAKGYRLHIKQLADSIADDDLIKATTYMNSVVEATVRQYPSQHEWLYRRFWDRPKGQPPLYDPQK